MAREGWKQLEIKNQRGIKRIKEKGFNILLVAVRFAFNKNRTWLC
jgi:hypothetical protein